MRKTLTAWLNEQGNKAETAGHIPRAIAFYRAAIAVYPKWSVPFYNLGLLYKNASEWERSLKCNRQAAFLNPQDEGAWWNLAIAATALHDWKEARRAWRGFGLDIAGHSEEVATPQSTACVRLNPLSDGEVVWGTRIDPARIEVLNVPLPNSKRRYKDIILNDGAPNGMRTSGAYEYPVFDELAVWRASSYSTFEADLEIPDKCAEDQLIELCAARDVGIEDWGTVRIICEACSKGTPGPHECALRASAQSRRRFGFAATSREILDLLLAEWVGPNDDRITGEVRLAFFAGSSIN